MYWRVHVLLSGFRDALLERDLNRDLRLADRDREALRLDALDRDREVFCLAALGLDLDREALRFVDRDLDLDLDLAARLVRLRPPSFMSSSTAAD